MQRRMSHDFAVTEFDLGERYSAQSTSGPFPMSVSYSVKPCEEGSRLHSVSEIKLTGLMAMAESAMKPKAQERFDSDHRNLKRILES